MSGKQFDVIKQKAVIITNEAFQIHEVDPVRIEEMQKHWNELTIPKRFLPFMMRSHPQTKVGQRHHQRGTPSK